MASKSDLKITLKGLKDADLGKLQRSNDALFKSLLNRAILTGYFSPGTNLVLQELEQQTAEIAEEIEERKKPK